MKRILLLCLSVLLVVGFPTAGQAAPSIQAESYIMADAVTGKILLQSEADVSLPPASMTKLMTLYLVRRQIELKKLTWDQKITPSAKVLKLAKTSGIARVPVKDKTYTVREMYNAAFIKSANDAAVMLAETVAGSEAAFVEKMNETAKTVRDERHGVCECLWSRCCRCDPSRNEFDDSDRYRITRHSLHQGLPGCTGCDEQNTDET